MRRLLLGLMAASISGGEANRLLDHFYAMDSDFSGTIEMQELAIVAKQVKSSPITFVIPFGLSAFTLLTNYFDNVRLYQI